MQPADATPWNSLRQAMYQKNFQVAQSSRVDGKDYTIYNLANHFLQPWKCHHPATDLKWLEVTGSDSKALASNVQNATITDVSA